MESRETLTRRLNLAFKKIDELRKLYEKLWDDYHQAQKLIMRLEEENEYLRQKAVDNCSKKVRFDVADGCNNRYIIRTAHDEVYVDRDVLTKVLLQIAQESMNGSSNH